MSTRSTACALVCLVYAENSAATVAGMSAATSGYVLCDLSQTNADPALQAGFERTDAGFYADTRSSNLSGLSDLSTDTAKISSSLEIGFPAGHRSMLREGVSFDLGALGCAHPGDVPPRFHGGVIGEIYGAISLNVFTAKYSHWLTDLSAYADSDGSGHRDFAANVRSADTCALGLRAGRQWRESNASANNGEWKVGVIKADEFSRRSGSSGHRRQAALNATPFGNEIADATAALTLPPAF